MPASTLYVRCSSTSSFLAMLALMHDGMFPPAVVLLVVGAGLMTGACIFADRL